MGSKAFIYIFISCVSFQFCNFVGRIVMSCESEIALQTLYLYLLSIFFKQLKFISVVFFASVIDQNASTSLICKNEKKYRIRHKIYASKLRAGAILDSHGCTYIFRKCGSWSIPIRISKPSSWTVFTSCEGRIVIGQDYPQIWSYNKFS